MNGAAAWILKQLRSNRWKNSNETSRSNLSLSAGQVTQLKVAVGTSVEAAERTLTYTANGKLASLLDGENNLTAFAYDGHDRLQKTEFPAAAKGAAASNPADYEELTYDANGNVATRRTRAAQVIAYNYDALNRMTHKGGPAVADVAYAYDLRGLQTGATFVSGGQGIANAFNGFGELVSTTTTMGGTARTLSYLYDAHGNRTRITHPDGPVFTYTYDGLDRPTAILEGTSASLAALAYDRLGRRTGLTRGNGAITTYGYDGASRLESLAHDFAGAAGDVGFTYAYSPASQIVALTRDNDAYAFTALGSGGTATVVNGLNQIATKGGTAFTYDANGNLTSDGTWTYGYDGENRLVSASKAGVSATLSYDPLGRLWQVAGGGIGDVRFLMDPGSGSGAGGDAIAAEYSPSTGIVGRRYVHGPGADEPLVQYEGAGLGAPRFLHADRQGSVIAHGDPGGTLASRNSYDEYGVAAGPSAGRFGYTGQAALYEVGVNYYKARMYSPPLGVFLQTDPVGYEDGANLYAYVGGDPVNATDPSGMYECSASKSQCESIDNAYSLIGKAAASYSPKSKEAAAVNGMLKALGKPGEDNGVTIGVGRLDKGTLGQTSASKDGINVTLDFNQINAGGKGVSGGGLLLGAVALGHEAYHVHATQNGRRATTAELIYRSERRAHTAGSLIARPFGAQYPHLGLPAYGSRNFGRDLNRIAYDNCISRVVESGNGVGAIMGNCQ